MDNGSMKAVLVATPDSPASETLRTSLKGVTSFHVSSNWEDILVNLKENRYDFLFLDTDILRDPKGPLTGEVAKEAIGHLRRLSPALQILAMAPNEHTRDVVQVVKAGARDYLTYPLTEEEIQVVTDNALETLRLESEVDYLRGEFWGTDHLEEIRSDSEPMQEVFRKVRAVAPTKSTVLLTGETGTGKGVLARLIHMHSNRKDKQFISIHCGAIPDTLLESELFGHERGAFTGANRRKFGKFEIAQGGTIFLDEIGTITPSAQIKLLQVLQDRTLQRLGGEKEISTDVRIIAASNVDLKQLSDEGLFRKDLYYRLSVFPIEIPPLRARPEDIPYLSDLFARRMSRLHGKEVDGIHTEVLDAFQQYDWPGNIRELENLIERAFVLQTGNVLTPSSFPRELFGGESTEILTAEIDAEKTLKEVRKAAADEAECLYLREVLKETNGRIDQSAHRAGVTTRQIHLLMKKHGIRKEEYK